MMIRTVVNMLPLFGLAELIGARVPNNGREERQPRSGASFPYVKLERRSRSLLNPRILLEHKGENAEA